MNLLRSMHNYQNVKIFYCNAMQLFLWVMTVLAVKSVFTNIGDQIIFTAVIRPNISVSALFWHYLMVVIWMRWSYPHKKFIAIKYFFLVLHIGTRTNWMGDFLWTRYANIIGVSLGQHSAYFQLLTDDPMAVKMMCANLFPKRQLGFLKTKFGFAEVFVSNPIDLLFLYRPADLEKSKCKIIFFICF